MKRCPDCGRNYNDDSMSFCLDDGSELLFGPASSEASTGGADEPATAILHSTAAPGEAPTRAQINTTNETAVLPANTGEMLAKPRGLDKRLLAVPLLLAIIALGGYFGYRYFKPASGGPINSIAVLPFQNKSGDPNSEYLSDGLAESLNYRLSQIPKLKVSPTSSVIQYKGKDTKVATIASEVGVDAVMTGRLAQIGDNLTISVELVDVRNNKLLWGEQYERKMSELLATQREIAATITQKLQLKLSGEETGLTKKYTNSNEAYQLYLKGRYNWNARTIESLKQAAEFYKQAIEKDPNFALAYAGLGETYTLFAIWSVAAPKDSMPQARSAALQALELDESLAAPHAVLAYYLALYEWDRVGGEKEFRRAIELEPSYAAAYQWLGGSVLAPMKRFDEAIAELKRGEEIDPLSSINAARVGDTLVAARRYDEAIAQYKRILSIDPNFAYIHYALSWGFGLKGMYPEAISEARRSLELNPDPTTKAYLALWLAKAGQRAEATKLLDELKQESTKGYVQSYAFALVYLGFDDKEEALRWLEKEVSERGVHANFYSVYPELDPLRSEPRFKAMLKQVKLQE
jgi:TolB-like protein